MKPLTKLKISASLFALWLIVWFLGQSKIPNFLYFTTIVLAGVLLALWSLPKKDKS